MDETSQKADREMALVELDAAISSLERSGRDPDQWEMNCLLDSLGEFAQGMYSVAAITAATTTTPATERSRDPRYQRTPIPLIPTRQFRADLQAAEQANLRVQPIIFGTVSAKGG